MAQVNVASKTCDFCKELYKTTATFYCEGCEKYLCIACKRDFHEKTPVLRNHTVVLIKKAASSVLMSTPFCCGSYRNKCDYYCSSCNCFTCSECMKNSHNGHSTDTIKHFVDVYHEDAKQIMKKLKAELEIVQRQLDTIKGEYMRQIQLDYYSYVEKVEKTSRELHGIVDHIKSESNTAASDHQNTQTKGLKMNQESLGNHYDYMSSELLKVENLLHESDDVKFVTEWKRFQQNEYTVRGIDGQHQMESLMFSEDSLMTKVMENINKNLKNSILKDNERDYKLQLEVRILNRASKRQEDEIKDLSDSIKVKEGEIFKLQMTLDGSRKALDHSQDKNINLLLSIKAKEVEVSRLQRELNTAKIGLINSQKETKDLSEEKKKDIKDLEQRLRTEIRNKQELKKTTDSQIATLHQEIDTMKEQLRQQKGDSYPQQQILRSPIKEALLCVAIDIGSSHAGFCYGFRSLPVTPGLWDDGMNKSPKTSATVLFDAKKECVAFGYEAEYRYSELVADGQHEKSYYFHRFRELLRMKGISKDIQISDILDKPLGALCVFASIIKLIKDRTLADCYKQTEGITVEDIHYVLTVPAQFDDSFKQFIRESAVKAGIPAGQITILLEPIATLHCQLEEAEKGGKKDIDIFSKNGTMFMVVDLGGRVAEVTVFRNDNGILKEVIPPSGGPWGGNSVDDNFYNLLIKIFGANVMEKWQKNDPTAFLLIFRQFELAKRARRKNTGTVNITMDGCFVDLVSKHCQNPCSGTNTSLVADKFRLKGDTFKSLFQPTIEAMVKHLEGLLCNEKLRDLDGIVMVGGFSESEIVQDAIKERFRGRQILVPNHPSFAVMEGAVRYGFLA
ncbi:uncharacterized protein [Mytilus edulis]|uniref:uncharacterized protein n=1 Tax=Mytilus edulis TaxID=6550 RepID=UPI0039F0783E